MKEIQELLGLLGLTKTEADLYLAGLSHGSVNVQELGALTKIKRPTIYHAIGTLTEKGLVAEERVGGKLRFTMAPPTHLAELVRAQQTSIAATEKKLEETLPALLGLTATSSAPVVSAAKYEGVEGIKAVLDIAIYCKSKTWDIIAPIDNFLREYDPEYAKRYLLARKYYGITSRSLWERDFARPHRTSDEIAARNPRFLPQNMEGKFKSMLILFDDKIAIINSLKNPSAVLITSTEAHQLLTLMFESLWEAGEPYAPL